MQSNQWISKCEFGFVIMMGLVLLVAPASWSQEDKAEDTASTESSTGVIESEDSTETTEESEAKADVEERTAAVDEKNIETAAAVKTAAVEETVFSVQAKPYLVKNHFEISLQGAQSINDTFTSHSGLFLSVLYHFQENVAFELAGGMFGWWDSGAPSPRLGGREAEMTLEMRYKESLAPQRVKTYQYTWFGGGDLQWSPLYGKVSFHEAVLGQFSVYVSVGAGAMGLQLPALTAPVNGKVQYEKLPNAVNFTTNLGGGLRFYFTKWFGVRLEVRDYVNALTEPGLSGGIPSFDVANLILFQGGVSFLI